MSTKIYTVLSYRMIGLWSFKPRRNGKVEIMLGELIQDKINIKIFRNDFLIRESLIISDHCDIIVWQFVSICSSVILYGFGGTVKYTLKK